MARRRANYGRKAYSCRYCGQAGHNRATCPDLVGYRSSDEPKTVSKKTCSYCRVAGHTTRTCQAKETDIKAYLDLSFLTSKIVHKHVEKSGVAPGAMLVFSHQEVANFISWDFQEKIYRHTFGEHYDLSDKGCYGEDWENALPKYIESQNIWALVVNVDLQAVTFAEIQTRPSNLGTNLVRGYGSLPHPIKVKWFANDPELVKYLDTQHFALPLTPFFEQSFRAEYVDALRQIVKSQDCRYTFDDVFRSLSSYSDSVSWIETQAPEEQQARQTKYSVLDTTPNGNPKPKKLTREEYKILCNRESHKLFDRAPERVGERVRRKFFRVLDGTASENETRLGY